MIGKLVEYSDEFGERKTGIVRSVESDDLDEVKMSGERFLYWSKKTKSWREVRENKMDSLFFEIEQRVCSDFVLVKDVSVVF